MLLTHKRSLLISAVCIAFGVAQAWAAHYLTTVGAPGQAWRLDGGFGALIWGAGLTSACAGVWAGLSARRRV